MDSVVELIVDSGSCGKWKFICLVLQTPLLRSGLHRQRMHLWTGEKFRVQAYLDELIKSPYLAKIEMSISYSGFQPITHRLLCKKTRGPDFVIGIMSRE